MSTLFSAQDYDTLATIVFRPDYPGNATARGVVEAPNGDGYVDMGKRYSHVASKYIAMYHEDKHSYNVLSNYLQRAFHCATAASKRLGVTSEFMPCYPYCALRVLEYPPGAGSAQHTDFDLFTLNLYRDVPNDGLATLDGREYHMGEIGELIGLGSAEPHRVDPLPVVQRSIVYFAMPSPDVMLPSGQNVGQWLEERKNRSRYHATT